MSDDAKKPAGRLRMMLGSQVLFDSDEEVPAEERDRRIDRALRELGVEPAKGNGQDYAPQAESDDGLPPLPPGWNRFVS